jgi:hypothetical protein
MCDLLPKLAADGLMGALRTYGFGMSTNSVWSVQRACSKLHNLLSKDDHHLVAKCNQGFARLFGFISQDLTGKKNCEFSCSAYMF